MREQMARAIFVVTHSHSNWDSVLFRTDRADSFAQADAALDALLEPTLEMAKHAPHYHDSQDGVHYMAVFTAMIRAAKDGK